MKSHRWREVCDGSSADSAAEVGTPPNPRPPNYPAQLVHSSDLHSTTHRAQGTAPREGNNKEIEKNTMATLKDGGRNDRLSWSKRAEHVRQKRASEKLLLYYCCTLASLAPRACFHSALRVSMQFPLPSHHALLVCSGPLVVEALNTEFVPALQLGSLVSLPSTTPPRKIT